jgi:SAM-dependent methyltransferase
MMPAFKAWVARQRFLPQRCGVWVNRDFIMRRGLMIEVQARCEKFRGRVLDFGCGEKPYHSLFKDCQLIGADTAQGGHEASRKHADVWIEEGRLPLPDADLDGALCTEVVQYLPDPDQCFAELARVLKPGAPLLITHPFAHEETEIPHDLCHYTAQGLRAILERCGFRIEECVSFPSYLESLTQLLALWLSRTVLPWKHPLARLLSTALVLAPLQILGIAISRILPGPKSLYLSVVILARRNP